MSVNDDFDLQRQLRIREANKRMGARLDLERRERQRGITAFLLGIAGCFIIFGGIVIVKYLCT